MTTIIIDTVTMSLEAARSVEWAGVDVAEDLRALRAGETTYEQLLAECLDGCEDEHADDWRDYVSAVCAAADNADEDDAWTYDAYWASVLGAPAARIVAEYELSTQAGEIRAWLDRAQIAAWQVDGDGGRMPGEWTDTFFEDAAAALYEAALTAEQDAAVRARVEAEVASCESGRATGEACAWDGDVDDLVTVEWMPEHLRASHQAAGNCGEYPFNGAKRLRCCPACAETFEAEVAS